MSSSPKKSQEPYEYSLSRYFSKGTQYYYGYPTGVDSHFYITVPAEVEEVVAARPMTCAGPGVKIICFATALTPDVWGFLHDDLGVLSITRDQVISFPKNVTAEIRGDDRNKRLKKELAKMATPGKLVMAQPYLDSQLKSYYQIPPHRVVWMNDKRNMSSYIPEVYLPQRYAEFLDGRCFIDTTEQLPIPCVVKVTSSSSGDGVRICRSMKDLEKAKREFKHLESVIAVDECIDVAQNIAVQFGIPQDPDQAIDIIGWHEQLTDPNGVFLGGILDPHADDQFLKPIFALLLEKILPEVRKKGWYGIGGFDILMDKEGRFYFVDCNFRMTGMTAVDCFVRNHNIQKSLVAFFGTYRGTAQKFRKTMGEISLPGSDNQLLHFMALTESDGVFRFNAAMLLEKRNDAEKLAKQLMKLGIESAVLKNFATKTI
ncbi:MAG: hypothetical protein AAB588_05415 [Patescibacteria group bacterium]